MWAFLMPFFGIVKRYWKPLSIVVGLLFLTLGAYVKGNRDCSRKQEVASQKEAVRRLEDAQKEEDRLIKEVAPILHNRASRPDGKEKDAYDSCLLSTDPFDHLCK